MAAPVDYTPVLLAQVTDLQMRLTNQEALIQSLKSEVERLAGRPVSVPSSGTMRASVPLQSGLGPSGPRPPRGPPRDGSRVAQGSLRSAQGPPPSLEKPRRRPQVAPSTLEGEHGTTLTIQDVLHAGEEVTVQVGNGRDSEGNMSFTTAVGTFDGVNITITKCDLAPSLVGMKTTKPGEILYKFIDELKAAGHIRKTFSTAPWRLCFVERDGVRRSLEELRAVAG